MRFLAISLGNAYFWLTPFSQFSDAVFSERKRSQTHKKREKHAVRELGDSRADPGFPVAGDHFGPKYLFWSQVGKISTFRARRFSPCILLLICRFFCHFLHDSQLSEKQLPTAWQATRFFDAKSGWPTAWIRCIILRKIFLIQGVPFT